MTKADFATKEKLPHSGREEAGLTEAEELELIQRLCLMDDEFMTCFFDGDTKCTELVLHIVIGTDELCVKDVKTQYTISNLHGRSVRLDIHAVDSNGKEYDIEIQRADEGASEKRARYNSSLMDSNRLKKGESVQALPETYVIFFTERDVLGGNLPIYRIDRTIEENGEKFADEAHIVYVNGAYEADTPLGRLVHDFKCQRPEEMHYPLLKEKAKYYKESEEGVKKMSGVMKELYERAEAQGLKRGIAEGEERGLKRGIAQGEERGRLEERRQDIQRLLKKGYSTEEIADIKGMSTSEVEKMAQEG